MNRSLIISLLCLNQSCWFSDRKRVLLIYIKECPVRDEANVSKPQNTHVRNLTFFVLLSV